MYFEAETGTVAEKIKALHTEKNTVIVGIDGKCASGKTTLAKELSERLCCNIIHTDDFYLQSFQRTEKRYAEPGGNLDRERLADEVLVPLSRGKKPLYRPFICRTMDFGDELKLDDRSVYIIEGSYSCHPELRDFYDITVFVTVDKQVQKSRILLRNGEEKLKDFLEKWIPLEEKYFEAFETEKKADVVVRT